jgi:hypothetical protein
MKSMTNFNAIAAARGSLAMVKERAHTAQADRS